MSRYDRIFLAIATLIYLIMACCAAVLMLYQR